MNVTNKAAALLPAMIPLLQATEGGGVPWWIWLIVISVLLLLLLIGLARQPGPGEPLPTPEERMTEMAAAASRAAGDAPVKETPVDPVENAENDIPQEPSAGEDEEE